MHETPMITLESFCCVTEFNVSHERCRHYCKRLTKKDRRAACSKLSKTKTEKGEKQGIQDKIDVVPLVFPVLGSEHHELLKLLNDVAYSKEAEQGEERDVLGLGLDRERVRNVDACKDDVAYAVIRVAEAE